MPFAFNSYPASWIKVLDSLLALNPTVVVPGHGPMLHDLSYVRSLRSWLKRINREASAAAARGDSVGAALKAITLDDARLQVTKDEKWMNFLFRSLFVRPAVMAAFEQAGGRAVVIARGGVPKQSRGIATRAAPARDDSSPSCRLTARPHT